MSDEMILPMLPQNNVFSTEVRGTQHTYYLTGTITEPENYLDLCNILRTSGPQDEVLIRINSRGGSVASERMIVNAMEESEANVIAYIEYDCMSAATGVFLAAKQHGWAPHIQFMAHCAFWGSIGKNPDVKSQTEFGIKQLEEEIVSTYSGLLTESEIAQLNDGKEFWFGAKELETRMEQYYEYKNAQPCDCGSADCQSNQESEEEYLPEFSLEDMISNAVNAGVESAMNKLMKKYTLTEKVKPEKPTKPTAPATKLVLNEKVIEG